MNDVSPSSRTANANAKRTPKMASQSLNHLLNFSLPPRQSHTLQSIPRRSRKTGNQNGVWNKEKFVNAQYRFVMKPTGDYTVHFADPDIYFEWQDILQVIIPRTSALAAAAGRGENGAGEEGHTTCPICLSPPTAPRMTKCGHVYCFPCILHYLQTSDNAKWNRCPICFDSVNEKQLKSVKWFDEPAVFDDESDGLSIEASSSSSGVDPSSNNPRPGSILRMRLMQRPQITTLALPRSKTWPSDVIPPHQAPFHFLPDVFRFSKFMLATPDYLTADLGKDLDALETEKRTLTRLGDDLGVIFVDAAEIKVRNQIAKAADLDSPILKDTILKAENELRDIERRISERQSRQQDVTASQETSDIPDDLLAIQAVSFASPGAPPLKPTHQPPIRGVRLRRNINPPPPSTSTYYYYQAASGAPIFLHPLDIRVLFSHFNSYESFPDAIAVRVDAFSEGTVNDDLRKRCKYLAHMPEASDVVFVEADLADVVGADGLKNFEGLLRMRRAKRKDKVRKDDRAKARAEEKERERLAGPWAGADAPVPLPPVHIPASEDPLPVDPLPSPPPPAPRPESSGAWGARSFASALHAPSSAPRTRSHGQSATAARRDDEDDWDMEAAWHELENRPGRKKRGTRLVVLGGGGPGGGRRR